MSNLVRVIDLISGTTLFQTTIEKMDDAYAFATQMEEVGLDVEIKAPGLAETLIKSLGAGESEIRDFKQSLQDEIDEHDDSDNGCGICAPPRNNNPAENLGEQFNLEDYLRAQKKSKQVVLAFSKLLKPGMNELETKELLEKILDESGMQKRWHPSKMRIGPNTIKNFRDNCSPHIISENDIFFVDIGPVYDNHEGDYGETFTLGSDQRLKKLAEASQNIFNSTLKVWQEKNLTGIELYKFAEQEAHKLNLKLNSNMYGHRMGDFPHAVHSKAALGSVNFTPAPKLWILEIHLIDEELGLGSFFEDLLI